MMFWSRSSSAVEAKPSAPSAPPASAAAAHRSSRPPASLELSEQRRGELLLAARASRVSWVDGLDEARVRREMGGAALDLAAAVPRDARLSTQSRAALREIGGDMQRLLASLEQLKAKVSSGEVEAVGVTTEEREAARYRTLVGELQEQKEQVERWLKVHASDAAARLRAGRMGAREKEMVFLAAFQELLALLKHPRAAEFVYQIQTFVNRFDKWDLPQMLRMRVTRDRPGGHIHAFIDKLVRQLRHSKKLAAIVDAEMQFLSMRDELGDDLLHEVLEGFLMEKLYAQALTPTPETARQDEALHARIKSLGFVSFRHLDLPAPRNSEDEHAWEKLTQQLHSLVLFKSPRRKMDCVLRVCQDLTTLLARQNSAGRLPSADEFLPGLIYLLLRANPRELKRNVNFILEYRSQSKLVSEPGYFFTHLVSSVAFLEEVNGSLLTITPEEFEEGLRKSKQAMVKDIQTAPNSECDSRATLQKRLDHGEALMTSTEPTKPDILAMHAARVALWHRLQ